MREKLIELLDKAKSGYEDYLAEKDRKMRMAKTDADFEAEANTIEIRHSFYARELITNGVTVQQWVPVSVRLPEEHGEYIVVIKGTNRATTLLYHPIGGTGRCPGSLAPYPVTHWMPLPEPPKENE